MGIGLYNAFNINEIRFVVRAKAKPGTLPRLRRHIREESGLQNPIFPMAAFGPRIGEKHIDFGKGRMGGQGSQKGARIRLQKVKIPKLGPGPLALGPADPVGRDVDPYAAAVGMGGCVGGQEVPVPAPHLPCERTRFRSGPRKPPGALYLVLGYA